MVDREKLAQRLMATFLDELRDHVATLNQELLALEDNPPENKRGESFKLLFRAAHSLKGASRAVNVDLLERVCHRLEDILDAGRSRTLTLTPPLFSLLFKTIDGIEDAGTKLRDRQSLDDSSLHELLADLEEVDTSTEPTESSSPDDVMAAAATSDKPTSVNPPTPAVAPQPPDPEPAKPPPASDSHEQSNEQVETPTPAAPPKRTTSTVRVASDKLDALLAQTGELLVARRRVETRPDEVEAIRHEIAINKSLWRGIDKSMRRLTQPNSGTTSSEDIKQISQVFAEQRSALQELDRRLESLSNHMVADSAILNQTCSALEGEVYRVRMLPFAEACGGLERAIRDVARSTGKQVKLAIHGEDVEIDRGILDALKDPLLHLVRNAIDHGIESSNDRLAAGKPAEATITVAASLRGQHVEITVQDDGRGFDLERIRDKARSKGWAEPDSDEEVARLVFVAGFSTASMITDISGRGVGLDVVQSKIENLQGAVDVSFERGQGSCFTLTLPLTLTTTRAIMVRAGKQTYAIPTTNVHQILRIELAQVRSVGGRHVVTLGGPPLAISRLTKALELTDEPNSSSADGLLAIVVVSGQQKSAIVVDELLGEQDVTVKPLGSRIRRVRHVSGATLLETGEIALVLNMANVVRSQLNLTRHHDLIATEGQAVSTTTRRLLVVDDSVTTRTLIQGILEADGFDVETASDGQNALEQLKNASFDLVVSDVDMPRVNGFELTEAIRQSKDFANMPIVLVTARGTDDDKARGVASGANAYIVKSGFDQSNLLATIRQLL